jgi:hypothetical protein
MGCDGVADDGVQLRSLVNTVYKIRGLAWPSELLIVYHGRLGSI